MLLRVRAGRRHPVVVVRAHPQVAEVFQARGDGLAVSVSVLEEVLNEGLGGAHAGTSGNIGSGFCHGDG